MPNEKIAIVTGANRGIGFEICRQLTAKGVTVVLTARSAKSGQAACDRLRGEGLDVRFLRLDVTDEWSVRNLAGDVEKELGGVDILINNAGVGLYAPSFEAPPELVRRMFALNLLAPVELVRRLKPLIPRGGAIVNISSIAGKVPLPWLSLYSASKFALNAFSDALRMELGASGIHVLSVCPGYVDTPFRENVLQGAIPDKVAGQRRFMITAEQCAQATLEGLRRRKRTVVTPRISWVLVALARLFPGFLYRRLAKMNPSVASPGPQS